MLEPYDLRRLPQDGDTVAAPLPVAWLELRLNETLSGQRIPPELELRPLGDGQMKIALDPVENDISKSLVVRVHGKCSAEVETDCVRCLSPVRMTLDGEVETTFFPESAARPDAENEDGQLDEATYRDLTLDLPEVVREALLLAVDMFPACPDEKACTERTQALMAQAGVGGSAEEDPRWDALRNFPLKSN